MSDPLPPLSEKDKAEITVSPRKSGVKKKKVKSTEPSARKKSENVEPIESFFIDEGDATNHTLTTHDCPTQKVIVFSNIAEVTRTISIEPKSTGLHNVIIGGFPKDIDNHTFRACVSSITGPSVKILEVSYSVVHQEESPEEQKSKMELNHQKLIALKKDKDVLHQTRSRLQAEEDFLLSYSSTLHSPFTIPTQINDAGKLTHKYPTLEDAGNFLNMYREKLLQIKLQKLQLNKTEKDLQDQINDLEMLTKSSKKLSNERREVTIEIRVQEICPVYLELSYIIKGAHWTSSYDVRVDTELDNLTLIYYGSIVNSTQEDWKDVNLILSTAAPAVGGFPPPLFPILVTLGYPPVHYDVPVLEDMMNESDEDDAASLEEDIAVKAEAKSGMRKKRKDKMKKPSSALAKAPPPPAIKALTSAAEEMATGSAYPIMRKTTITSDGKPHKVTINHLELPVTFEYVCPPTKTSSVYLRAIANNNTTLHLLKGPMNVFMNNYFITKSELAVTNPKETFKLYLGIDQGIKVDFQPIVRSEATQSNLFATKRTRFETVTHTTKIMNLKKKPVTVILYDQKPFTQKEDQIKIKIEEHKGIQPNPVDNYNIISWNIRLDPEQENSVSFKYSVEYPLGTALEEVEQVTVPGELPL